MTCFIVPCPPHHWVPYQNQVFFSVSRIMLNLQIARNRPNLYVIWLLWQTSRISGYSAAPPIRKSVPSLFASNTFLNRSSCALLGQRRVQTQSETMLFLLLSILATTCHRNWFLLYVYWDIHIMNKMKVYHISSYIIIYHISVFHLLLLSIFQSTRMTHRMAGVKNSSTPTMRNPQVTMGFYTIMI